MSVAKVNIWDKIVGYLYWDDQNQTAIFESDKSYFEADFSIAPILHPDKRQKLFGKDFNAKFNGLIPTFNDSLPDSFGNIVFKEWMEQNNLSQNDLNPIERLLYIGKRGVGALEFEIGHEVPNVIANIDLKELSEVSNKILQRKYAQNDYLFAPEALNNILTIGSSVGGAQAKILTAITPENQILAGDIIQNREVDYFIIKLAHDVENVWNREKNIVEFVYNQIAKDAGIKVADSKLLEIEGRIHFASKRFDRVGNQKVHQQTVNALSGFYGRNNQFSYLDIFGIIDFLSLPYEDSDQLFRQMVFNVLASNRDDHTKNFSFLMNKNGEWRLSPAYDLTFPFDPYQQMYLPHQININGKTKDISLTDLKAVAKIVGIRNANQIIDELIESVSSFSSRISDFSINKKTVELIEKDLARNRNCLK
jgi:serine/threonine-protein kinase HipA